MRGVLLTSVTLAWLVFLAGGAPHHSKTEWPFYAAITRGRVVTCGGALVSADWVLTSARCTQAHNYATCIYKLDMAVAIGVTHVHLKWTSTLTLSGINLKDCEQRQWPVVEDGATLRAVSLVQTSGSLSVVRATGAGGGGGVLQVAHLGHEPFLGGPCLSLGLGLHWFVNASSTHPVDEHRLHQLALDVYGKEKCRKYDRGVKGPANTLVYDKICGTVSEEEGFTGEAGAPVVCGGVLQAVVDTLESEPLLASPVYVLVDLGHHRTWILDTTHANYEPRSRLDTAIKLI